MVRLFLGFTFIILLLYSCVQEFTPDAWDDTERLVVQGEIDIQASNQVVRIFSTINNSGEQTSLPEDLKVEIFEENNPVPFILTAVSDNQGLWQMPSSVDFVEGENYFFKVSPVNNFIPQVYADVQVPAQGSIEVLHGELQENVSRLKIDIKVNPSADAKSYYHLTLMLRQQDGSLRDINNYDFADIYNGAELLSHRNGMLIDYRKLSEDKYLSFYVNNLDSEQIELIKNSYLYFDLQTVSEDYYIYHSTLTQLRESFSNPFSLPIITFSNINNGYGLFALNNTTLDSIRIQ